MYQRHWHGQNCRAKFSQPTQLKPFSTPANLSSDCKRPCALRDLVRQLLLQVRGHLIDSLLHLAPRGMEVTSGLAGADHRYNNHFLYPAMLICFVRRGNVWSEGFPQGVSRPHAKDRAVSSGPAGAEHTGSEFAGQALGAQGDHMLPE